MYAEIRVRDNKGKPLGVRNLVIGYAFIPLADDGTDDNGFTIRAEWHGGRIIELDTGYAEPFDTVDCGAFDWQAGKVTPGKFMPETLAAALEEWCGEQTLENLKATLKGANDPGAVMLEGRVEA